MDTHAKNRMKIEARKTTDGAGAQIKRVFPGAKLRHIDPFVLLDEFFVSANTGFPEHPHRGFEALTYMLEGAFRHKDNLGNDGIVDAGGVQRFSAGKGIRHSELPGDEEMNHGLQLWINLPKDLKDMEPTYQKVESDEIPEKEMKGLKIRTIVGPGSPVELNTAATYKDLILDEDTVFEEDITADWNAILYVIENELKYKDMSISPGECLIIKNGGKVIVRAEQKTRFVLIAGKPHDYPIKQHGSVVD